MSKYPLSRHDELVQRYYAAIEELAQRAGVFTDEGIRRFDEQFDRVQTLKNQIIEIESGETMNFIDVILSGNFVVLDTETTGLDHRAELCQIAIVDAKGQTLIDTLIKPERPIPHEATRIHGINNDMVAKSPTWADMYDTVLGLLRGREVVVYNAEFDSRILYQSCSAAGVGISWLTMARWWCAMQAYAEYRGIWSEYFGNYSYCKLELALLNCGLKMNGAHSAIGDARATLELVKHLVTQERFKPTVEPLGRAEKSDRE